MTALPTTTREGAWRELAEWLANGELPGPVEISFNPQSLRSLSVDVDSRDAFDGWCKMLGFSYSKPTVDVYPDCTVTRWWDYWNGWHASVTLRVPAADMDIPGEGGEVAGSDVGPGSATAPPESAAGVPHGPADETPDAVDLYDGGASAASPAPVGDGGGAAVTPDVWVPIRRRGTNYHQADAPLTDRRFTTCGRYAGTRGTWLSVAEAVAFGAVPCPRCYGTEG